MEKKRALGISSLVSLPQQQEGGGGKKLKLQVVEERITCNRRWEMMDHDVLVSIMKLLIFNHCGFNMLICKSWFLAFLDALYPPGHILDLSVLDDLLVHNKYLCRRYLEYLNLVLGRRADHYTELVLPKCFLHHKAYRPIAERLPSLKSFIVPTEMSSSCTNQQDWFATIARECVSIGNAMFPCWKNLEHAHINTFFIVNLSGCNFLRSLHLTGCKWIIQDVIAALIGRSFPLLEHLSMSSYTLSRKGFSSILDGHKTLQYLDMRHCICVEDTNKWNYLIPSAIQLPEDISRKVASIKTLLRCSGEACSKCKPYYPKELFFYCVPS